MTLKEYVRKTMDILGVEENEKTHALYKKVPKRKVGEYSQQYLVSNDDREFLFPCNHALQNYDVKKSIIFNPIGEEKRGSDTESFKLLCKLVSNNLRTYITATSLAVIAGIAKCEKVTDMRLSKFISKVVSIANENGKKIDHATTLETVSAFKSLLTRGQKEHPLLTMITKRPFEKDGVVFSRGVVFTFPLYTYLKDLYKSDIKDYKIFDIKMSKYQLQLYLAVLELTIVGATQEDVAYASNDKNFPSYISVMKAYNAMLAPLFSIYKDVEKKLSEVTPLNFNLELLTEDELDNMKHLVDENDLLPTEKLKVRREDAEPIIAPTRANQVQAPQPNVVQMQDPNYPYGKPSRQAQPVSRGPIAQQEEVDPVLAALRGNPQVTPNGYIQDVEPRYQQQQVNMYQQQYQQPMAHPSMINQPYIQQGYGYQQPGYGGNTIGSRYGVRF